MLYFYTGSMRSGKTTHAIKTYYAHKASGDKVGFFVPDMFDNKKHVHASRDKLFIQPIYFDNDRSMVDIVIEELSKYTVIILDECQFINVDLILKLRELANDKLVYCYGLRFDMYGEMFDATNYLLEVADRIETLNRAICDHCKKNPGYANVLENPELTNSVVHIIDPEENDDYKILCYKCYDDYTYDKF